MELTTLPFQAWKATHYSMQVLKQHTPSLAQTIHHSYPGTGQRHTYNTNIQTHTHTLPDSHRIYFGMTWHTSCRRQSHTILKVQCVVSVLLDAQCCYSESMSMYRILCIVLKC